MNSEQSQKPQIDPISVIKEVRQHYLKLGRLDKAAVCDYMLAKFRGLMKD